MQMETVMKLLTTREPFVVEFTLEELRQVELALEEVHRTNFQRMKQLLETTGLIDRVSAASFVSETREMLDELESLDLCDEDGLWDDDDLWDEDEWDEGPDVPCHLMPRPTSGP